MLAADTSSLVEFLRGSAGSDIDRIETALEERNLILPPVVLSEILSDPKLSLEIKEELQRIPSLPLLEGFWIRAGLLRAKALSQKKKARLGDALIAQFCIDHEIPLVTRDKDFSAFKTHGKLLILD